MSSQSAAERVFFSVERASFASSRAELLAPLRIEFAKSLDAFRDWWMCSEEGREALRRKGVYRVERLGHRARSERDEFLRLLEAYQGVGERVRCLADPRRLPVGCELALR
jgi:hypothetical protein